jgi:hypothetical protein
MPFGTPGLSDDMEFFFLLVFPHVKILSAFDVPSFQILVRDPSLQLILVHHSFRPRCLLIVTIAPFEKILALCSYEHTLFCNSSKPDL